MRTHAALVLFALVSATAGTALAQDTPPAETPPVPPPVQAAEPPAPPVMIAVLASGGHVPDDVVLAVQSSLVDGVRGLAGGRPVLPLALPEMRDRLAACADATCQGAFLAETGAIGAVIARLSRRTTRGEIALTLDMIDPISGSPRVPQQAGSVVDAAGAPAVLAPMIETLRASMFSPPPPPPTLLVTVNVDGATVAIDGTAVGLSPIASQRLTPGHHVVLVSRGGYAMMRRELDSEPGAQDRLDIVLVPLEGEAARTARASEDGTPAPSTPWYEEWYVWAGIGGGLVVVGAVIAGVVVATQPPPPDPMGTPLPGIRF